MTRHPKHPPRQAAGPLPTPHQRWIRDHVELHVGPVAFVLLETAPSGARVDVLVVRPTPQLPQWTLVTSGMSHAPMRLAGCCAAHPDELHHAELVAALPADWDLSPAALDDPLTAWPVSMLLQVARHPHEADVCLGWAHTVGSPDGSTCPGSPFAGALLHLPQTLPLAFPFLTTPHGTEIDLLTLYPLHARELAFAEVRGVAALLDALEARGVTERIDVTRPACCDTTLRVRARTRDQDAA